VSNQPESLKSNASASAEENLPIPTAEEHPSPPMKLVRPPSRPAPVPAAEKASAAVTASVPVVVPEIVVPAEVSDGRLRPIPPPSEPTQYRAIGVVRGTYQPSDEQFTRGNMVMHDGSNVEAVLLGRVMSLVRNHLELEKEHVWVVYPRTREREATLHLQIVGVWEPENLTQPEDFDDESEAASSEEPAVEAKSASEPTEEEALQYVPSSEVDTDTFSIRGEIISHEPDAQKISVKIQQVLRKKGEKEPSMKYFKLNLEGDLRGKVLGYFWDLDVKRTGQDLKILGGTSIVLVMPKKYPKRPMGRRPMGGGGGGFRSGGGGGGGGFRGGGGDRDARPPMNVPSRKEGEVAPPKPVMKKKEDSVAIE
jgi:uncharacterized membrane protein YgcG